MKNQHIRYTLGVLVAMVAFAGSAHAQQSLSRDSLKGVSIGVRGCVKPGIDSGTVVLNQVLEVGPDGIARPPVPRGLPTAVYSFNDATRLLPLVGRMVEVRGRIKDIKDSEIEIKPGPDSDETPIAEIQRPGKDVKAALEDVPVAVGTSGTNTRIKTVVLEIDVDRVTQIAAACPARR
jgi:hypothetical protein